MTFPLIIFNLPQTNHCFSIGPIDLGGTVLEDLRAIWGWSQQTTATSKAAGRFVRLPLRRSKPWRSLLSRTTRTGEIRLRNFVHGFCLSQITVIPVSLGNTATGNHLAQGAAWRQEGAVSIVVATSVLAEGIDIPSCGLVLCCLAIGEIISWDGNIFLGEMDNNGVVWRWVVLQTWPFFFGNVSSLSHCSHGGIFWVPKSSRLSIRSASWKGSLLSSEHLKTTNSSTGFSVWDSCGDVWP